MNILLGVTGSIAIYKSCDLTRELVKKGHNVQVIMSYTASKWISPDLFTALSSQKCYTDDDEGRAGMLHIKLSKKTDLMIIAPATAHLLSEAANGSSGNLINMCLLYKTNNIWIAPAMNPNMYKHPATQRNLEILSSYGYTILSPVDGETICGDNGEGKMIPIPRIVELVQKVASNK